MRPRFAVLVSLLAALIAVASPAVASATPHHTLTINATPNPVVTGNGVLIYGQLNGPGSSGQTVVLYHRVNPDSHFTIVGMTTTNSFGFYQFSREEGVVLTNRSWVVTARMLAGHVHSRVIHESVQASLSLTATPPTADTSTTITFSGSIAPPLVHVGEPVFLQVLQGSTGGDWHTLKRGVIQADSSFSIPYRFVVPGIRELRVAFRGDIRNAAAQSDAVSVTIQQAENPLFTINTTAPIIDDGAAATISGLMSSPPVSPATTPAPQAGVWVTLWAHRENQQPMPVGSTVTGNDGSYSFTVRPDHNVIYQTTTTFAPPPRQASTRLFEGVRDVVALTASATSGLVGQTVTFQGAVAPDKADHIVYLQERGRNGEFQTIASRRLSDASAYQFSWMLASLGTDTFRTLVPDSESNVSGHSAPVTITVGPPPPQGPTTP